MEKQIEEKALMSEFDIRDMLPLALTVVVTAIGVAYGLNVLTDVKADFTTDSVEYNATGDAITGVSKLTAKLPLIMTVVVAAIVIGILLRYLFVDFMGRR